MADDVTVQINESGGTAVVDTKEVSSAHRQIVVIGDPSTAGGVAPVDATNGLAVDVKTMAPGTGASSLGKAEDAVHASGDVGVMALTVRKDTAVGLGADGDYVPIQTDANGRLVTLDQHSPAIKAAVETIASTGIPITGTVTVGSHAVTNAGTFAVQVSSALPAGNNNIGDVDVASVPTDPFGANADAASATGSISAKLRFIAATGIPITGTVTVGSHAVTNAGTFVVQLDGAALTSLQLLDDAVSGAGFNITQLNGVNVTMGNGASGTGVQRVTIANDSTGILAGVTTVTTVTTVATLTGSGVAHDGADSGNPHKVGGRAMTTARTAVSDGDRADVALDVQGRVITERDGPRELDAIATLTLSSTTTETSLLAAVASTFLDILDVIVINSSASASRVDFRDDTAGTIRFFVYAPAGSTVGFSGQRWPQAVVNKPWTAQCSASVAAIQIAVRARKTK